jgi:hypothetical protein
VVQSHKDGGVIMLYIMVTEKTGGEGEIRDVLRGWAKYLTKIGDKVRVCICGSSHIDVG